MIKRLEFNPILISTEKWEVDGAFNQNVLKTANGYKMVYRAVDENGISRVAAAESVDGLEWSNKRLLVVPDTDWDNFGCEDPRMTFIDGVYYIFYTAISQLPPNADSIKIGVAISDDLVTIKEKKLVTPFNAKAAGLFSEKINGQYILALTANTDLPPSKMAIAKTDKIENFWNENFWKDWYSRINDHEVKLSRINTDQVELGSVPMKTGKGWLWFYCHIRNYGKPEKIVFGIEAFLTDLNNPTEIIGRTEDPLLVPYESYEVLGQIKNVIFPSGATDEEDKFRIYYGASDNFGAAAEINKMELWDIFSKNKIKTVLKLRKYSGNPILTPNTNNYWENRAVFNPAVVFEQGKFHLLYRALASDLVSTIGYATSSDGFNFDFRFPNPIYMARTRYARKMVEGNYSGCEDPRIVKIDDKFYIFYTAYNGKDPPRVAMSWIKISDFMNQDWLWAYPILISPQGEDNKDASLFPEKIGDKFLMLHRIGGKDIVLDWIKDLSHFDGTNWLQKEETIKRKEDSWEGEKIGIGATPIKTEKGWILIYHGMSDIDRQYRVGIMLLDLADPHKVLARTKFPVLEPTEDFEKKGWVNNVVFPCGATIVNNILYVYYGGADKSIGVATINVDELLKYLYENI